MAKGSRGGKRAPTLSAQKEKISGGGAPDYEVRYGQGARGYSIYERVGKKQYVNGFTIFDKPPKGWKKVEGFMSAPNGLDVYFNGKSLFSEDHREIFVKSDYFDKVYNETSMKPGRGMVDYTYSPDKKGKGRTPFDSGRKIGPPKTKKRSEK